MLQDEQACAAASKTYGEKLEKLIKNASELFETVIDETKEDFTGERTYNVADGVRKVAAFIKDREEMVSELRKNACHRLDTIMVPLLRTVADQVSSDKDLLDHSDLDAAAIDEFYTQAQHYAGQPVLASSLAALQTWKCEHQESLNARALSIFIDESLEMDEDEFDIHECQRLIENLSADQSLETPAHMCVSRLTLARLCHEA